MNSAVYALAISGSDLYAGGQFTTAGGNAANDIAKWNGSAWSALGEGMNDYVICAGGLGLRPVCGGRFHHGGWQPGFQILPNGTGALGRPWAGAEG